MVKNFFLRNSIGRLLYVILLLVGITFIEKTIANPRLNGLKEAWNDIKSWWTPSERLQSKAAPIKSVFPENPFSYLPKSVQPKSQIQRPLFVGGYSSYTPNTDVLSQSPAPSPDAAVSPTWSDHARSLATTFSEGLSKLGDFGKQLVKLDFVKDFKMPNEMMQEQEMQSRQFNQVANSLFKEVEQNHLKTIETRLTDTSNNPDKQSIFLKGQSQEQNRIKQMQLEMRVKIQEKQKWLAYLHMQKILLEDKLHAKLVAMEQYEDPLSQKVFADRNNMLKHQAQLDEIEHSIVNIREQIERLQTQRDTVGTLTPESLVTVRKMQDRNDPAYKGSFGASRLLPKWLDDILGRAETQHVVGLDKKGKYTFKEKIHYPKSEILNLNDEAYAKVAKKLKQLREYYNEEVIMNQKKMNEQVMPV